MKEIDNYYLRHNESMKGCLLALRQIILASDENITEAWKYRMPFFLYKKKMFCYLWVHPKTQQPYIGIVEGKKLNDPALAAEKRARMKVMYIDAEKDLPIKKIKQILKMTLDLYR